MSFSNIKKTPYIFSILITIIIIVFIPTDKTTLNYTYICDRGQNWVDTGKKELNDKFNQAVEAYGEKRANELYYLRSLQDEGIERSRFKQIEVNKSGLRREIEGRLAWIGIDQNLDFLNKKRCPSE